jgi:hypothetical protein
MRSISEYIYCNTSKYKIHCIENPDLRVAIELKDFEVIVHVQNSAGIPIFQFHFTHEYQPVGSQKHSNDVIIPWVIRYLNDWSIGKERYGVTYGFYYENPKHVLGILVENSELGKAFRAHLKGEL